MTLRRSSSKLPHSVLHRIAQLVSDGEIAFNRRIKSLLEEPKLSSESRKMLERQKKDLGMGLRTLRLVSKQFSRLAIEFMNFTISAKKVIACPEFRLGIAQRLRTRFRKVVFDSPYSSARSTENDFLIQLLPLFTNLSSISFQAGTAEIFHVYHAETTQLRQQQAEQRRRVLEHVNSHITSVSFVGQTLEHVVDLLRLLSKEHLVDISLDWTVASQVDSTHWEAFFKALPPSVKTLEVDRSPPEELSSKESKESTESKESKKVRPATSGTKVTTDDKQAVVTLSSYPKEWLVTSNWPSFTKIVLRLPSYTSIDRDFLAQFESLEALEIHQTYGMDDVRMVWNPLAQELEDKLVAIPALLHLRSLSLSGIQWLAGDDLLRRTIYDHEDSQAATEEEIEPSAMEVDKEEGLEASEVEATKQDPETGTTAGEVEGVEVEKDETKEEEEEDSSIDWSLAVSRVIDPDSPFVVGCDSYLEEQTNPCIHELTCSRPFPKLEELTVQSVDPCIHAYDLWDFVESHSSTLRRFNFYNLRRDWPTSVQEYLASKSILQGIEVSTHPYHSQAHISKSFLQKRETLLPHWFDKSHPQYAHFQKPNDDALIVKLKSLLDYGQERLKELVEQVDKGGEAGDLYRFASSLKAFEFERAARYD